MKVVVSVLPREGLLDPQGSAVAQALSALGLPGVARVRVGKRIELELAGPDSPDLRAEIDRMCRDLLSNPVIEDYVYEVIS